MTESKTMQQEAYFVVYGKNVESEMIVEGPLWSYQKAKAVLDEQRNSSLHPDRFSIRTAVFTITFE